MTVVVALVGAEVVVIVEVVVGAVVHVPVMEAVEEEEIVLRVVVTNCNSVSMSCDSIGCRQTPNRV